MGYNFVNMRVGTSVTIGSLQEIDRCKSDGDLENDLDLVFQSRLIKMDYNCVNMRVRTSVTIGSRQVSDPRESDGDLEKDLVFRCNACLKGNRGVTQYLHGMFNLQNTSTPMYISRSSNYQALINSF